MGDQLFGLGRPAGEDVQDAGGKAGFQKDLADKQGDERRRPGWPEDDRVAGREGAQDIADRDQQRKILGRNDEHRAQRLEFEQALIMGEKREMRFRPL
jgi:hypothetical protein